MVRATVARGRTVTAPDPAKREIAGTRPDGSTIYATGTTDYGPGAEIELSASEVQRLRATGFLVDPGPTPVAIGEGPKFSEPEAKPEQAAAKTAAEPAKAAASPIAAASSTFDANVDPPA